MKIGTIILLIIVIAIIVALCMLLGKMGVSPFDQLYNTVMGYISGFSLESFLQNPTAMITTLLASAGGIGGILLVWNTLSSKLSAAKQQLSSVTSQATSQIDKLKSDVSSATESASTLTEKFEQEKAALLQEKTNLTQQLTDVKSQLGSIDELKQQKASLQNQLEDLKNTSSKTITQLQAQVDILSKNLK